MKMHGQYRSALLTMAAFVLVGMVPAGFAADKNAEALKKAEEAAERARKWLKAQCTQNGVFGQQPQHVMPGIVGIAAYALAMSEKEPGKVPEIARAAKYLVGRQMENGAIAIKEFRLENYNTSIAVMALAAMKDPKYKDVLEKAKNYILSCQLGASKGYDPDKHSRAYGGFGYGSAKRADLSNTQFSLEALKALGVKEDSPAFKNALIFVRRCQDNLETNKGVKMMENGESTGGFVYLPGESMFGKYKTRKGKEAPNPYGGMTYAGIKSLIFCGLDKKSPELQAAWKWVRKNYSVTEHPGADGSKGYYYYLVAMAKAFTAAGERELETADGRKVFWARDLGKHLAKLQSTNGTFANPDPKWMEADPIMATSYALIALNLSIDALKAK